MMGPGFGNKIGEHFMRCLLLVMGAVLVAGFCFGLLMAGVIP